MDFANRMANNFLEDLKERWSKASPIQKIGIAIVVYPVWPTGAILAPFVLPADAWQATTEFMSSAGTLATTVVTFS